MACPWVDGESRGHDTHDVGAQSPAPHLIGVFAVCELEECDNTLDFAIHPGFSNCIDPTDGSSVILRINPSLLTGPDKPKWRQIGTD